MIFWYWDDHEIWLTWLWSLSREREGSNPSHALSKPGRPLSVVLPLWLLTEKPTSFPSFDPSWPEPNNSLIVISLVSQWWDDDCMYCKCNCIMHVLSSMIYVSMYQSFNQSFIVVCTYLVVVCSLLLCSMYQFNIIQSLDCICMVHDWINHHSYSINNSLILITISSLS